MDSIKRNGEVNGQGFCCFDYVFLMRTGLFMLLIMLPFSTESGQFMLISNLVMHFLVNANK